jgi:DNA-binding transcriptional regulator YiaG
MMAELYHYTESGLRNVWLANGYKLHKTPHGEAVAFDNVEGLHMSIGRWLCAYRPRLSGPEFRFLRHELDLSQGALAKLLGNDAQSVALWEKAKIKLPAWADRWLRALYREHVDGNVKVRDLVEAVSEIEASPAMSKITARKSASGWQAKAA